MSLLPLLTLMATPSMPKSRPLEQFALYFTADSAELNAIAEARLDETAHRLGDVPLIVVKVEGYGPAAAAGLGERRAAAARDYLVVHHGIDPARITVEGLVARGEAQDREAVVKLSIP